MRLNRHTLVALAAVAALVACAKSDHSGDSTAATAASSASAPDSAFTALARAIIEDRLKRYPSNAVDLGVHKWDDHIEDYSRAAVDDETRALKDFYARLSAIDTTGLSADNRADRELLMRSMDAGILGNDVIKSWTKNADAYSGGVTNA